VRTRLAVAVAVATLAGGPAAARVTDPDVINTLDTRFEGGVASPVGFVGGSVAMPWRYAAVEGSAGWGITGWQLSSMVKAIPARWRGGNTVMVGVGATVALPAIWAYLGERRSWWQTAEVAWQRVFGIDRIIYIGLGVVHGKYYESPCDGCQRATEVVWPELRVGFGMRR
jgi:hypothetical protein